MGYRASYVLILATALATGCIDSDDNVDDATAPPPGVDLVIEDDGQGGLVEFVTPAERMIMFHAPIIPSSSGALVLATLADPWERHDNNPTGCTGADGVDWFDIDEDGDLDFVVPCEQSSKTFVFLQPADPWNDPWTTYSFTTAGAEDAKFGDFDNDGCTDIAASGENKDVFLIFVPCTNGAPNVAGTWTKVTVTSAHNVELWMQLVVFQQNGKTVFAAGGRRASLPAAGIYLFTASSNYRSAGSWAKTLVSTTGYTMSLLAVDADADGDQDLVTSDRDYLFGAGGTHDFSKVGTRWIEFVTGTTPTYTDHMISHPAHGEPKMMCLDGDDIVDGSSNTTGPWNLANIQVNPGSWSNWSEAAIALPTATGLYHAPAVTLWDQSKLYAFSYSDATGALSGVAGLVHDGNGGWDRVEISGEPGTKYDNLAFVTLNGGINVLVTTEQVDQLGLVFYVVP